jgi:hypothetical protein
VRLRVVVPRSRRGRGLGGLSRARRRALVALAAALCAAGFLVAAVVGGTDDEPRPRARVPVPAVPLVPPPAPPADREPAPDAAPASAGRLAIGLTERNAGLLFAQDERIVDPGLEPFRERLEALRPAYHRLSVDWAQLQPSPGRPAQLDKADDGCLRGIAPCGPYSGIRDQLRAVASQQRAHGGWEVVVLIYGVPDWAARPAGGCERPGTGPRSRPITAAGLRGYRRLIGDLDAVARDEGVRLRWWAPWNEPNQPFFVSPQRVACTTDAQALAPSVYAQLVRAARAELRRLGGDRSLVLGELAGFDGPRPFGAGIREFVAALPDDVACAGDVWSQHAYAEAGAAERAGPVGQLKRALAERPCTRSAPIWVTETGVGGARSGEERDTRPGELRRGCRWLDALLRKWYRDPRVDVAFQYTFREDPAFPVGLADPALTRAYPTYDLWRAWGGRRAAAGPVPEKPCSG